MRELLAITLWQPWATLWVHGPKIHETRMWRPVLTPRYLAVHAAQTWNRDIDRIVAREPFVSCLEGLPGVESTEADLLASSRITRMPRGVILGVVELGAPVRTEDASPRSSRPIACSGTPCSPARTTGWTRTRRPWPSPRFVDMALTTATLASELEVRGPQPLDDQLRLRARVAVAERAAGMAARAIHTPMDGTLAKVHAGATLIQQAQEEGL